MIEAFSIPVKRNKHLCDDCIHKCSFKDINLCNIDTNPSLFYFNSIQKPIVSCADYVPVHYSYPKINIHAIWDWCAGFVFPTPVIICCKHEVPEFEQPSIDEIYPHCNEIAKGYNIKIKGFPWVINLAEIACNNNVIKKYRTNLISNFEIENILKNIK